MASCPNITHPDWIELVDKVGKLNAYRLFIANNDMIPDVSRITNIKEVMDKSVNYILKAVNILESDKAKEVFAKGEKNNWSIDKILTELAIPKEQKALLLESGLTNREELLIDFVSNYSYVVEVSTVNTNGSPNQKYSTMTVPGGTNYTNNEILIPDIIPGRKGHAEFSTDNGIGWFRSDDKISDNELKLWELEDFLQSGEADQETAEELEKEIATIKEDNTKIRRVLEVQSDLFQKNRGVDDLIKPQGTGEEQRYNPNEFTDGNSEITFTYNGIDYRWHALADSPQANMSIISEEEWYEAKEKYDKSLIDRASIDNSRKYFKNKFLQLLNQNNNWVTFFIKSIMQDSAKKGYNKVLFPSGETAAKVEGHQTIANDIKRLDNHIVKLEDAKSNPEKYFTQDGGIDEETGQDYIYDVYSVEYGGSIAQSNNLEEFLKFVEYGIKKTNEKRNELKETGIEKLKPIEAFYEIKINNILNKQYGKENVNRVTDTQGNTWNEVVIDTNRELSTFSNKLAKVKDTKLKPPFKTIKEVHKYLADTSIRTPFFKMYNEKLYVNDNKGPDNLSKAFAWVERMNEIQPGAFSLEREDIKKNKYGSTRKYAWHLIVHESFLNSDISLKELNHKYFELNEKDKAVVDTIVWQIKETKGDAISILKSLNNLKKSGIATHSNFSYDLINAFISRLKGKDVTINVAPISSNNDKLEVAMQQNGSVITINSNSIYNYETLDDFIYTMLHELVHIPTTNVFNAAEDTLTEAELEFKNSVSESFKEFKAIAEEYRKVTGKSMENKYGLTNEKEFIAEILSNRGFMSEIKNLSQFKYEQDKQKLTVWQKLVNAFYKLFMGKAKYNLREKTNSEELYNNAFNTILDYVKDYKSYGTFSDETSKMARLQKVINVKHVIDAKDPATAKKAFEELGKEIKLQQSQGVKFESFSSLKKKKRFGTRPDDKFAEGSDKIGSAVHDTIDSVVKDVVIDIEGEYGYKVSPKAKESLKSFITGLKSNDPGMTLLSESKIADLNLHLVGKIDLITISSAGVWKIYDFKTKVKGFAGYEKQFIPKDIVTDPKDPNYEAKWMVPYSDRQSVHLQLSMYKKMLQNATGILATTMNVVMFRPIVEGNTITDIVLDKTISPTGVDTFTTYSKDLYQFMPATKVTENGVEEKTGVDSAPNVSDEGDYQGEFAYREFLAEGYNPSKLESILATLIERLKNKQKILENSRRFSSLQNENANKFIQKLVEETNLNKSIILVVKQALKSTNDIMTEMRAVEASKTKKFTPEMLGRWKDYVSSYDALDDLQNALELNGDLVSMKSKEVFKQELDLAIRQKNAIKQAYIDKGIPLIAEYFAPYYDRLFVLEKMNAQKAYRALSDLKKAEISEDDYVENLLDINNESIEKATVEFLIGELRKGNGDINGIQVWLENTMDSRDPVVASMLQAFATQDGLARKDMLDKKLLILQALEDLENDFKASMTTDLAEYYGFMLERDEDGKLTGHYITRARSSWYTDYYEIVRIANLYDDENMKSWIKTAWKEGLNPEVKMLGEEGVETVKAELDRQRKLLDNDEEAYFTIAAINQISEEANAPILDTLFDAYKEAVNIWYDTDQISKKDLEAIEDNESNPRSVRYSTAEMVEKGFITEATGDLITDWFYKNTWDHRVTPTKYQNPQWKEFEYELQNPNNDMNNYKYNFYKLIVDIGKEGDTNLPPQYRLGTRLPSVVKQLSERIQAGQSLKQMFVGQMQQGLMLRDEDTFREGIRERLMGDDGKVKYFLPIHYTAKIDPVEQSFDIPSLYLSYWGMANDHARKSEILPEMELAKYIVDNRESVVGEGIGHKIVRKVTGIDVPQERKDKNANLSKQLNEWFVQIVYGERTTEGKTLKIFGKEISINKTLDIINNYAALNLLGFNFIQGTANVVLGESLQLAEAIAGEYISMKAYRKGGEYYAKNMAGILSDIGRRHPENVVSLLMERGNILNEYDAVSYRKNTRFRQLMTSNTAFFTSFAGEHLMQSKMYLGFLADKKAYDKDGNHIGQMLDFYAVENRELVLVPNEQGQVVDEKKSKWEAEDRERFDYKVRGVLSRLHGEYSDMGRVAIQRYAVGRMAFMFRKFIIPGWNRRWEAYGYNQRIGAYTEGGYITTAKFIKQLTTDMEGMKYAVMSEKWDNLTDMEKANIKRTLSEVTFLMAAIIIGGILMGAMDDDGKKDNQVLSFFAYQMFRYKAELLFFISPIQAINILRSPAASISVFENTFELLAQMMHPFEVYETGPNKDKLKIWKETRDMIPVYRQMYRLETLGSTLNLFK